MNERPICHRAEDLITYLYGEASEVDSRDFADHLQQCDACRVEFGVFQQVHDSILVWRNEALGSAFSPAALTEAAVDSSNLVRHQRKLSAISALREFFTVSPLWLRAATAFAALLLCVLGVLVVSRAWNRPAVTASKDQQTPYNKQQFEKEVQERVAQALAQINSQQTPPKVAGDPATDRTKDKESRVASNRLQPKTQRPRGLSRQEREQLAADLRLIPRDDDELPFVLSDEPNQ